MDLNRDLATENLIQLIVQKSNDQFNISNNINDSRINIKKFNLHTYNFSTSTWKKLFHLAKNS